VTHLVLALALASTTDFDHSHRRWTEVLDARARRDGVEYAELKRDPAKLDDYLASLEAVMPEEFAAWSVPQRFAFWINAYNAYTVRRVLDAYPVASPKDVVDEEKQDLWEQAFVPLGRLFPGAGDRKLTLNEIRDKLLRPTFKDARVHAALSDASRSSPPLFGEAYVPDRLEKQLDARVVAWLADPARNRYDRDAKRLQVSMLFERYRDDFVREADTLKSWIGPRAPEVHRDWIAAAEELKIEYLEFDWKLNDAKGD
jgi:hypothetical protein